MEALVSIAGFDTGNGAGVTVDLRVFRLFGFHGVGVITALTFQNSCEVRGFIEIGVEDLKNQIDAVRDDFRLCGAKVGIVVSEGQADVIGGFLSDFDGVKVLDPVMRASVGFEFSSAKTYEKLLGIVDVVTPNVKEAEILSGVEINDIDDAKRAAEKIKSEFGCDVVITGKDLGGVDIVYDGKAHEIKAEVGTKEIHGTGCVYSSSLLANLCLGRNLLDASRYARLTVLESSKRAKKVGKCLLFVDPPLVFD